ncbi:MULTISPECIES: lysylphosphatidylglycerol synthase transmembrane domain-containing protein [Aneurinibacillus]|uniref:Phosphatidylglycerol lysyltransferase n=1 Tax=Aneurinibacillus thermoaerophilus TaxID=143495 RepID=A0A1G8D3N9_ANETH|nr:MULTISPECIES: lysylphosphatidylglycerol synthase transmembrane domain-containing protein [Aneurinibacillus]AMA74269.1 hypothetical protein ACH33_16615 [Aneurinibacillus sp. XH2]MED0675749.1 lysylphosphatidylglycerol synthase transmembrane domain-containing protein [Aneurinibacillus thermoaerophilus]MED0680709.1 lysylphosphatidylglycerol synthase transmembrane domain-containing protein [Aneurinibacillus thermoaerophilus]MED0736791.1 lysylphosphatidylglycerol synthase transmembrane domain-cont
MRGKYIQLAVGIAITCLFLFLAYRNLGNVNIARLLRYPVDYFYVLLAVFAFAASQWFRALSWTRGFAPDIPVRKMFASVCMGNGSNMLLPFRMGEAIRVMTIGQMRRDYASVGVNLVLERLLDVFILIVLAVSVAFFVPFEPVVEAKLQLIRNLMLAAMVAGGLLLLLALRLRPRVLASEKTPAVARRLFHFLDSLAVFKSPLVIVRALCYLVCSWGCVYLSTVFGLMAVGIYGSKAWVASLVVIVLTNLIMLIPSAPGGIGVFQYACIYSLSLFDVHAFQRAILSVLLHLVQYAALLPLSIYYFMRGEFTVREIYRNVAKRQRARLSER